MIFDWLDEEKMPGLTNPHRLMGIILDCQIVRRDQLLKITGWPENKLHHALKGIRQMAKGGDKEEWLISRSYDKSGQFFYTLGAKGIGYAKDLKGAPRNAKREYVKNGGYRFHDCGLLDILIRLIDKGHKPAKWINTLDCKQWFKEEYSEINLEKTETGWSIKTEYPRPIEPDALLEIEGRSFLIEFDRGNERKAQILEKNKEYMEINAYLKDRSIPPVVWVTTKNGRREELKRWYEELVKRLKLANENYPIVPMYFFVEGDETEFLLTSDSSAIVEREQKEAIAQVAVTKDQTDYYELYYQVKRERDQQKTEINSLKERNEYLERMIQDNKAEMNELAKFTQRLIEYMSKPKGGSFLKRPSADEMIKQFLNENPLPQAVKDHS